MTPLEEAQLMADKLTLDDASVLRFTQEGIRRMVLEESSRNAGGVGAYLDAEAAALWNEAIRIAFDRWKGTADDPA